MKPSMLDMSLLKRFWREIAIAILAIVSYFALTRKPEIKEVVKTEYVDRVVEKIVTVEKEVVKNKKKRTTVQKPDGTTIVREVDESVKTEEKNVATDVEKETTLNTEITKEVNSKSRYNLNIDAKLYPETEYSASLKMRLGDTPLFAGPVLYVRPNDSLQIELGLGIQIEI